MSKWRLLLLILVLLLLLSSVALVEGPEGTMELDRWVMGGGEMPRTGGPLAMQATIGQPAVGYTTVSALGLYWGYWGSQQYLLYLPLILNFYHE